MFVVVIIVSNNEWGLRIPLPPSPTLGDKKVQTVPEGDLWYIVEAENQGRVVVSYRNN